MTKLLYEKHYLHCSGHCDMLSALLQRVNLEPGETSGSIQIGFPIFLLLEN